MHDDTVRRTITVRAPVNDAFEMFTTGIAGWWPHEYSWSSAEMETVEIEPVEDGTWYERSSDGTSVIWGRVLAWDPPQMLVLGWQISPDRTFEPDPLKASEIEVQFIETGPTQTRVELEHRNFARHGAGADAMREGMKSAEGWPMILDRYAAMFA